jgi:hypothetical protein
MRSVGSTAERLVHKLVPANDRQSHAVEIARRMIWWFYRRVKEDKLAPSPQQASLLQAQFDRMFKRRTGYATLDRRLRRRLGRKHDLLRGLERPEIPLNAQRLGKRHPRLRRQGEISGGTVSEQGRQARDVRLGRAKTRRTLKIPVFDDLGAPPGPSRPQHPQPRNPRQPRPKLTNRPGISPRYQKGASAESAAGTGCIAGFWPFSGAPYGARLSQAHPV